MKAVRAVDNFPRRQPYVDLGGDTAPVAHIQYIQRVCEFLWQHSARGYFRGETVQSLLWGEFEWLGTATVSVFDDANTVAE